MRKKFKKIGVLLCLTLSLLLTACGVIDINGKTFVFGEVTIDWGRAEDDTKSEIFEQFLVSDEKELLTVLKTRDGRDGRVISFGTDYKYHIVGAKDTIIQQGYYKQNDDIIFFSDEPDNFNEPGLNSWKANQKGIVENYKLNDEYGVFASYLYVVKN